MKKFVLTVVLIGIISSLIILELWSQHNKISRNSEYVESTLDTMLKQERIQFKLIDEFEWDRAIVYPPYTSKITIERDLDIKLGWLTWIKNSPEDENFQVLVFLYGDKLVACVSYPRIRIDFIGKTKKYYIPADSFQMQ